MSRLSTCKQCETKIPTAEKKTLSNKTYCSSCYEELLKQKTLDQNEYKELISSICSYFNINAPTGLILKQIKELKTQCEYSYGGMMYTLWYISDVLNKNLDVKYGIAQIKYEYEKAERYFIQQQNIENSLSDIKLDELPVKRVKFNSNTKTSKERFLIDIDKLMGDKNGI